ncbi:hypothetical protein Droror1_Dr00025565 [Drosera rotundifolia]
MGIFSCFSPRSKITRRRSRAPIALDEVSAKGMILARADRGEDDRWVKRYRWDEIEDMTRNFCKVIGVGGFSTVYLACLPDYGEMAAVKVYNASERLNQVFRSELDISRRLDHPAIVKLIGYCDNREEGVLVFEYISNGTLQEKLHTSSNKEPALPWKHRMVIAHQLAQALEYLHDRCSLHVVHGDVKSSNILLDSKLNCKLCDFGSAKLGFSSTVMKSANLMGSPGYIDPHFLMTGLASKKNDIYSLGIIILELITGLEAFSSKEQRMLASIVRKSNHLDVEMVVAMADRRIIADIDMEEATSMASLAMVCLHTLPSLRPSAADVCRLMKEKISSISFPTSSEKLTCSEF